jgi:hypothetical protein
MSVHCDAKVDQRESPATTRLQSQKKYKEDVPIVLLDIDGVLNMLGPQMGVKSAWGPNMVQNSSIQNHKNAKYPFYWCPAVVTKLNDWSDRDLIEVRWLTTWDADAPKFVAPVLGLRDWPLARDPVLKLTKLAAATRIAKDNPNRPIVWIDDDLGSFFKPGDQESLVFWTTRKKTLFIMPNALQGLTESDVLAVEAFIKNPVQDFRIVEHYRD